MELFFKILKFINILSILLGVQVLVINIKMFPKVSYKAMVWASLGMALSLYYLIY